MQVRCFATRPQNTIESGPTESVALMLLDHGAANHSQAAHTNPTTTQQAKA